MTKYHYKKALWATLCQIGKLGQNWLIKNVTAQLPKIGKLDIHSRGKK